LFPQYESKLRGTLVALAPNEGLVQGNFLTRFSPTGMGRQSTRNIASGEFSFDRVSPARLRTHSVRQQ
jgi:hypothetical protein